MTAKRERPERFDIDEKTLEYKDKQEDQNTLKVSTPDEIKERKEQFENTRIYKIKRPNEEEPISQNSKPKFTLFSGPEVNTEPDKIPSTLKDERLLDKNEEKDSGNEKPSVTSIFGPNLGGSLFGNGVGLFSSKNSANLFENSKNSFEIKGSIFNTGNDKNNTNTGSANIFGTSQSLFGKSAAEGERNEEGSGNEEDSAQLQEEQREILDPSKSTGNFKYNVECNILFNDKIVKLKKQNGEILENVEISVQENLEKTSRWIVIRLTATKTTVLSGLILKGKSEIRKMGNKSENLIVSVFSVKNKSAEKNVLKMQFENSTVGETFFKLVSEIIE